MKIKKKTIKTIIISTILILFIIFLISVFLTTGFLQASKIDSHDLAAWEYDDLSIRNTKEYSLVGRTQTCWILIHSYTATPAEMRDLANSINVEIGDFVLVIKLSGHGEVPSKLKEKSLDIWYKEVNGKRNTLYSSLCDKINVVGSSLGSVLALRLAEEEEIKNLYIINPFLKKPYEFYKILPFKERTKLLGPILNYKKKKGNAKINSPDGLASHISYWNMPYEPIKDSLPFIDETIANLNKIRNPTFIAFSENDEVAGDYSAKKIANEISSENNLLLNYPNSNHVLLADYDNGKIIRDIITFEKQNR